MHDLLKDFWKWANKSSEEYGKSGMNQNKGEFEDDFPLFENLITYAKTIVDNNEIEPNLIDDLLNIMALDNESEYLFICKNFERLVLPLHMQGEHKLWKLPHDLVVNIERSLKPVIQPFD